MRRQPRRPCRAREHDPQHVGVLVVVDERAEAQQLLARLRREPVARRTRGASLAAPSPRSKRASASRSSCSSDERVVLARLDAHQQAVERGDVDAGRVAGRSRAPARASCPSPRTDRARGRPRRHVPAEELLDELRDELAEIRMQPVDVLRPLALGQLLLRPGEVERRDRRRSLLRGRHGTTSTPQQRSPRRRRAGARAAGALGDHVEATSSPRSSGCAASQASRRAGSGGLLGVTISSGSPKPSPTST